MARPSATATLLLLVLSLIAVAHCRTIEAEPAESTTAVDGSDENSLPKTTLPAEAASVTEVVVPPVEEQHGGFLLLPSHRQRPCRHHGHLHRHLWWARHHGAFGDAPRRFRPRHGEEERLAVLPAEEEAREAEEVKAVAEPDPDRSLPDSDGADEAAAAAAHDDDAGAAWKKEMLRRWMHFHSHHGMHHLRHHHDEQAEDEAAGEGTKRLHHHRRHHDGEDEEKNTMRKRFRTAEQHEEDSDDEDDEVEEMVRRFRKAIMRRSRFGHSRRFHHHHRGHGYRHGEETEKAEEAGEEGGVVTWIKGLMNRF